MTSRLKINILITLVFSALFGFLVGAYPEITRFFKGYTNDQITVLTSVAIFPEGLLQDYQRRTGKTINLKIIESYHLFRTEAQKADLIFAPYSWTRGLQEYLSESFTDSKYSDIQGQDFLISQIDSKTFLPILWKIESDSPQSSSIAPSPLQPNEVRQQNLEIYGFSIPLESAGNPTDFIKYFTQNKKRLKIWSQYHKFNYTLKISDSLDEIPNERKARGIRDTSLSRIKLHQEAPQ